MNPLDLIRNPQNFQALIERIRQDPYEIDTIDHIKGHNIFHHAARTNLEIFQNVLRMVLEDHQQTRETVFELLSQKGYKTPTGDIVFANPNPFGIDPFPHPLTQEQIFVGYTPLHYALDSGKLDIARFIYDNCSDYARDGGKTLLSHTDLTGRTAANIIVSMRLRDNSEISPEMLIESYKIHFGDNFERLADAVRANRDIVNSVIGKVGLFNSMKIFKQFEGKSDEAFKIASQYLTIMYAEMGDDTVYSSAALDYFLTDATAEEAPAAPAAAAADAAAEVEAPAAAAADAAAEAAAPAEAAAEEVAQVEAPAALAPEAPAAEVEVAGDLLVQNADMFA
jgi:hypothetical protein